MTAEEWRVVPEFPGYEVSSLGRLRSIKRGMKRLERDRGYLRTTVSIDGVPHKRGVHQLVARAFIGPVPDGLEVRHIDGRRDNNVPSNLAYGTSAQNTADTVAHGNHNMARKTHCKRDHEFTEANTSMVLTGGYLVRRCKACQRDKARQRRREVQVAA